MSVDDVFSFCPSGVVGGAKRRQLEFLLAPGEPVERAAIKIWIVDFLLRELPDKQSGILLWVSGLADSSRGKGEDSPVGKMAAAMTRPSDNSPAPTLAILGGRFVTAVHHGGLFDLEEGGPVATLPPVFETRIFNLRILYRSCLERRKQWTNKPPGSGATPKARPSVS